MRILLSSAPPWACTGYGQQMASLIPRLQKDGHELGMVPIGGFQGGYARINGVEFLPPQYGNGDDKGNNGIIEAYAKVWDADFVLSLTDVWVLDGYGAGKFRWIPWVPVDGDPLGPANAKVLPAAWRIIAMSKHGQKNILDAGFESTYIPHGVENTFFPNAEAGKVGRKTLMGGIPEDAFVVGSVGLNYAYPGRKGFERLIEAFKIALGDKEDAYLYLHCDPRPLSSLDINGVVQSFGLQDKVKFPPPVSYIMGFNPEAMNAIYNGMDVFALATQGEGFGIPVIEAQAVGKPVIATDCTSMPELVDGYGQLVPPVATYMNPGHYQYYLVDIPKMADALADAYENRVPNFVQTRYDWDKVYAEYWQPFLEDVEKEIKSKTKVGKSRSGGSLTFLDDKVRKTDGPTANVKKCFDTILGLNHPNIIKPIGWGEDEFGRFYYDMPRYPHTLDEFEPGYFTEEQKQNILVKLTSALNYLHDHGIAHRDVHESNILLTSDLNPILIDFGWADECPGQPCVDFEPWNVRERATPRSQLGDQSGYHRIVAWLRGIDLSKSFSTALPGVPYQAIDGVGERDCEPRWEAMNPDVRGKTVLDVGCNLGWFTARAHAEGAEKVVGLEKDPATLAAAQALHPDLLGAFKLYDLDTQLLDGEYDVAFCLSVLQHLREPQKVLDRLREIADTVYIEVPEGVVNLKGSKVLGFSERNRPIVVFRRNTEHLGYVVEKEGRPVLATP